MKKLMLGIFLLVSVSCFGQLIPGVVASSIVAGGNTISDDFQAYTTGNIHNQGNWLDGYPSTPTINVYDAAGDKRVGGNSASECMAYYNTTFSNNHRVTVTIDANGSASNYVGVAVRCSDGMTYYALYINNTTVYFFVSQAWSYNDIITPQSVTVSNGSTIGLGINGTTITCYLNGAVWTALGNALTPATGTAGVYNDSRISAGKPGVSAYGGAGTGLCDNFYVEEL